MTQSKLGPGPPNSRQSPTRMKCCGKCVLHLPWAGQMPHVKNLPSLIPVAMISKWIYK